jgi:hypothetical protein
MSYHINRVTRIEPLGVRKKGAVRITYIWLHRMIPTLTERKQRKDDEQANLLGTE